MDDSYATNENTPLTIAAPGVLANDRDLASATMIAVLVSAPASGTLTLNPNGGFTYTPLTNFNGIDSFTYVENGSGLASKVATVTIAVAAAVANHAPVASDQVVVANEDAATAITLVATDAEGSPSHLYDRDAAGPRRAGRRRADADVHAGCRLQRRRRLFVHGQRRGPRIEPRRDRDHDTTGERRAAWRPTTVTRPTRTSR